MDAYSELSGKMAAEEIEAEVGRKIGSFHGLLTREVALRLIAKEKGLLRPEKEREYKIAQIPKDARKVSLVARVERILPEVVYPSGKRSRSVVLKDDTGQVSLKLWEENMALCSRIRAGSEVRVRNAYEKFGDLNLGYKGTVETVTKTEFTNLGDLFGGGGAGNETENIHVVAFVSKVIGNAAAFPICESQQRLAHEGMKTSDSGIKGVSGSGIEGISGSETGISGAGKAGFSGFLFYVSDSKNEVRVLIREGADRGKKIEEGDIVILEHAKFERAAGTETGETGGNAGGALILGSESRILIKKQKGLVSGKIERMEAMEGEGGGLLAVEIGGKALVFDRPNAAKFFGVKLPDDVGLKTLVGLKRDEMPGSSARIRVREENGKFIILE